MRGIRGTRPPHYPVTRMTRLPSVNRGSQSCGQIVVVRFSPGFSTQARSCCLERPFSLESFVRKNIACCCLHNFTAVWPRDERVWFVYGTNILPKISGLNNNRCSPSRYSYKADFQLELIRVVILFRQVNFPSSHWQTLSGPSSSNAGNANLGDVSDILLASGLS